MRTIFHHIFSYAVQKSDLNNNKICIHEMDKQVLFFQTKKNDLFARRQNEKNNIENEEERKIHICKLEEH